MSQRPRLKPVIYSTATTERGRANVTKQIILLKALQVTQDPKKLREMIGVRTVTEVYRTLDKLAMRKEYHEALARSGISFDYIVDGLKTIANGAEKDGDRLKAFQTLLKSLGLDKYDAVEAGAGGSWEEVLLKQLEKEKDKPLLAQGTAPAEESKDSGEYEVKIPEIPESMKRLRAEEAKLVEGIYE